ncbi:MAG: LuxR C-terminal-related transcriptional regulator, partial [Anderseniella sp.]
EKSINNMGFASFNFLDAGQAHSNSPYYYGTSGESWENEYANNGFISVDMAISKARRTNLPFDWRSVKLPCNAGRHRSRAWDVMDAAQDYGFKEGLVVPLHFHDSFGRPNSCLIVLFWKDSIEHFDEQLQHYKYDLHIILLYWMHRMNSFVEDLRKPRKWYDGMQPISMHKSHTSLSERERDVLAWAARGKTTRDTSEILSISTETVETHMRNAREKLGAANKSHSVALAMFHNLIDV